MRIAIVNCQELPEPDTDHEPLKSEIASRGIEVATVAWDGPTIRFQDFDLMVLRATWNYYHHLDAFIDWVEQAAESSRVVNPLPVVKWNSDKRYLQELSDGGTPVVPTAWLPQGSNPAFVSSVCEEREWTRIVVKPTISAASFATRFFDGEPEEAERFLRQQLPLRGMMIQPFMESTQQQGEKSIAWIDGEISHAWIKRPRFAGQDESVAPISEITPADREIVDSALCGRTADIDYARIDLMYDPEGRPLLSELELIEPSLYFRFQPQSVRRFVDALIRRLEQPTGGPPPMARTNQKASPSRGK